MKTEEQTMQDVIDNAQQGRMNIFLPVDKVNKSDDGTVTISGFASTPALDFQGEKVDPVGIDDSYFKSQGWIDNEHNKQDILGYPTENTFVDPDKGLFVEAKLFKNIEGTNKFLKLYKNIKDADANRKLGFSIEGQINQRDAVNPSIIKNVLITGVALTASPANPTCNWKVVNKSIYKSAMDALQAGDDINPATQTGGQALKPESLIHGLTNLSYGVSLFNKCSQEEQKSILDKVASVMDANPSLNPDANILCLQAFCGLSRDQASSILNNE
mgnify:CR=1 FL=1